MTNRVGRAAGRGPSHWSVGALLVFASFTSSACGPANYLDGSIGESFTLEFDRTQIRLQDDVLRIEYLKNFAGGETIKVVAIIVDGVSDLKNNSELRRQAFLDRVLIQRVEERAADFPAAESGNIKFNKVSLKSGELIEGEFGVKFVNGRGLNGGFQDELTIIDTN